MSDFNENRLYAEIECLKQRSAELAAQVEQSEAAKIHTARVSFRAGALRFGANLYLASEAADKYIEAMPAQCLANHDREVAARAVESFAAMLRNEAKLFEVQAECRSKGSSWYNWQTYYAGNAEKFAKTIRQSAKDFSK